MSRPKTRDLKAADLIGRYGLAVMNLCHEIAQEHTRGIKPAEKELNRCATALMSMLLNRPATPEEVDLASLTRDFDADYEGKPK